MEEQHHDAALNDHLGHYFRLMGDVCGDYYEQFNLSNIGTVSHDHDDRPPYSIIPPFNDDEATETPENYVGDDSGPVPDTHPDASGVSGGHAPRW